MKKLILLQLLFGIILSANSQNIKLASGDTLLYIPFKDIYVNAADTANFSTNNEDKDGYPIINTNVVCDWYVDGGGSYASNWNTLFKTNANDTDFSIGAIWAFAIDTYQADDWYTFGPVTIPSAGATFKWSDRVTDANDRNGYEVKISTSGLTSSSFTTSPIYSQPDLLDDPTITSNWYPHSYSLIASVYGGQQVYFAIHHNGIDVSTLQIDNIMIMKGELLDINEKSYNELNLEQNIPNPFNKTSVINYELKKPTKVHFEVVDMAGRKILAMEQGLKEKGTHQITINADLLPKGIYFYSLKTGDVSVTRKMIITE